MKFKIMKAPYILGTLLMTLPLVSMANNTLSRALGVTDSILLGLMIGFIVLLLIIIQALTKSIEGISRDTRKGNENKTNAKVVGLFILLGSSFNLHAVETTEALNTTSGFQMSALLFWALVSLIVFLAIIVGLLFRSLLTLIKIEHGVEEEVKTESVFETLKLTDNVPIEEEETVMMEHEYDGIRELDNNLPPWWKYMFYATIIFSFIYIIRYHITGNGQLQAEEYAAQMKEAELEKASVMASTEESVTEENVTYLADASSIDKGAAIYNGNCATCHGQLGEGGAGPNLTDEYWLHGGGIKNIFKSIKYGIPAKGMIAWQSQFSPSQMQKIASYVLTLQGTNPPNAKAPQGEIYKEEIIVESVDSTKASEL